MKEIEVFLGFAGFVLCIAFVLGFFEVLFECGGISQETLIECNHRKYVEFMETH